MTMKTKEPRPLIKPELVEIIKNNYMGLKLPDILLVDSTLEPVEPKTMLGAFSLCESSGGWNNKTRYEPIYGPNGKYYKASELQRNLYQKYGPSASSSHSSFQMMFLIFYELGYKPTPEQASNDSYAIKAIIKYFNVRIFKHNPKFLSNVGDFYNTGSLKGEPPKQYINKLLKNYDLVKKQGIFD